ncbi:MAG: ABC transporter ATP-binding protein [Chloroflexota bacterium]|nr:ABC transporter ATP-binding protein [Chloroflexota bacterium]
MDDARGAGATSGGATIEFDHVSKHYDAATLKAGAGGAVEDLSLVVPAGRICVLVGPSGCGKTTTLKMVNRLIEPTSGRILIDGVDITESDVTDLRRGIGYVIQQVGLFPHQTIAQNVATVPRLLGWDKERQQMRSDELLALVGLEPGKYRDRYPSQLSGGERQRIGVARALAADPPVMLMDEPFGAVDPIVRGRLQNEFLRLQEDLAKTILFVTHDIDEAIKMGDLVVVMQQGGKIAQVSAPATLLAEPASDYVARFVGTDRGLKRLSLYRVGDVELEEAPLAHVGEANRVAHDRAADAEQPFVLLLDDDERPLGWIEISDMPPGGRISQADADPMSPLLDRRATLKDATSRLLDEEVRNGVVVDRDGRVLGLLTLRAVMQWLQDDRSREVPGDIADAVAGESPGSDGETPGQA